MRHNTAQAISGLDRPKRTLHDVAVAAIQIFPFLCLTRQDRVLRHESLLRFLLLGRRKWSFRAHLRYARGFFRPVSSHSLSTVFSTLGTDASSLYMLVFQRLLICEVEPNKISACKIDAAFFE